MRLEDYLKLFTGAHNDKPKYMAFAKAILKQADAVMEYFSEFPLAFDLDSANGVQLDIIGEWVGLGRNIFPPIEDLYFSWNTQEFEIGWNEGVWKDKFDVTEGLSVLPDDIYRVLIKVKIAANRWNGTYSHLKELWAEVFAKEKSEISIKDNGDMTAKITIYNLADSVIMKQIINLGYLPIKPMGVALTYVDGGMT